MALIFIRISRPQGVAEQSPGLAACFAAYPGYVGSGSTNPEGTQALKQGALPP